MEEGPAWGAAAEGRLCPVDKAVFRPASEGMGALHPAAASRPAGDMDAVFRSVCHVPDRVVCPPAAAFLPADTAAAEVSCPAGDTGTAAFLPAEDMAVAKALCPEDAAAAEAVALRLHPYLGYLPASFQPLPAVRQCPVRVLAPSARAFQVFPYWPPRKIDVSLL